jgi:hypothetical protein
MFSSLDASGNARRLVVTGLPAREANQWSERNHAKQTVKNDPSDWFVHEARGKLAGLVPNIPRG